MPSEFWGEAVRHAVYVLNKLPTRSMSTITPQEAWYNRKPSVEHLKVFGCTAYMKIPSALTRKLDARSRLVVHLGREPGTKAYRLYDPVTQNLHISRDVIFNEQHGWDWKSVADTTSCYTSSFFLDEPIVETLEEANTSPHRSEAIPEPSTPNTAAHGSGIDTDGNTDIRDTYDDSTTPRRFRPLRDVYADSTEIELEEELLLMGVDEPVCFEQAITDEVWKEAMDQEISSIEKNQTWKLTHLPPGHKAIDLKWVFKVKKDQTGVVTKHKACLVAKGYVQQKGVDFDEVFAPVTRLETVRLLLALAAKNAWEVHHLDVKSAFLNGVLLEEVYVSQPKNYTNRVVNI